MFIVYVIDLSSLYFYRNKKYRRLEKEKNVFFSYFISGIPNFSYMVFIRKCSMFRRSTRLSEVLILVMRPK